jgi:hypothetical protein
MFMRIQGERMDSSRSSQRGKLEWVTRVDEINLVIDVTSYPR